MTKFFAPFGPGFPFSPVPFFGILGPFSFYSGQGGESSGPEKVPAHAIDVNAYQQKLERLYSGYRSRLHMELEAARQNRAISSEAEAIEVRIETELERIASPAFKSACRFDSRMRLTHEETLGRGRNRTIIDEEFPLKRMLSNEYEGKSYLIPQGFSKGIWYLWAPDQFCRVDEAGRMRSLSFSGIPLGVSFSEAGWQAAEDMFQSALVSEEKYLHDRFFERFYRYSTAASSPSEETGEATTSDSELQENEFCAEEDIEYFDEDRGGYVCADGSFLPEDNLSSAGGTFVELEWQAWLEYGKDWLNSSAMRTVVHGLGESLSLFLDAGSEENEESLEDFENE